MRVGVLALQGDFREHIAALVAIGIEAGKAYIRGYEIQKDSTTYVPVEKAREYGQQVAAVVQPTVGNYVLVTNMNALPPCDSTTGYDKVTIYDRFNGSVGTAPVSNTATIATSSVNTSTEAIVDVTTLTDALKKYKEVKIRTESVKATQAIADLQSQINLNNELQNQNEELELKISKLMASYIELRTKNEQIY